MANCRCGRPFGMKPHCPSCGSSNSYSVKSMDQTVQSKEDNKTFTVRAFHCRNCGMSYNEAMPCSAPLTREAIRRALDSQERSFYYSESKDSHRGVAMTEESAEGMIEMMCTMIKDGHKELTQEREDHYQKTFGVSLSLKTGIPVVNKPVTAEDLLAPPDDPDAPHGSVAMTDEQWAAWIEEQKKKGEL